VGAWIREASDYEPDRAEAAGDVIRRWTRRSGIARTTSRQRVTDALARLLGPDAVHTRLEGLRDNVATLAVDSSALLSELKNFRKQELLEGLRRDVKTYFVRDVRFRLEKHGPAPGKGRA